MRLGEQDGDDPSREDTSNRFRCWSDDGDVGEHVQLPARVKRLFADGRLEAGLAAKADERVVEARRQLAREENELVVRECAEVDLLLVCERMRRRKQYD